MGKEKSVLAFTGVPFAWEIHSRYHEMINKIIDKGRAGMEFNQLSYARGTARGTQSAA